MADSLQTPKSPKSNSSVSPRASQRTSRSSSRTPLVVFVFPGAAGHVNPSLPMVRRFLEVGWQVTWKNWKVAKGSMCYGFLRSRIEVGNSRGSSIVVVNFCYCSHSRKLLSWFVHDYSIVWQCVALIINPLSIIYPLLCIHY